MTVKLPPPPDFAALDATAAEHADERTRVLALIGNLVFAWSNNESMFIYVLMALLKTDLRSAAIVFLTLNTTRARLDLIRRLAKSHVGDDDMLKRIERLIERFNDCTKVRNDFNHCIYQINASGQITHTSVLRMRESKSSVSMDKPRPLDARRVREIAKTIAELGDLNRDLWAFLPVLQEHMQGRPTPPLPEH